MTPVQVGDPFARRPRFDADGIRAFAALCGAMNPLHHDEMSLIRTKEGSS